MFPMGTELRVHKLTKIIQQVCIIAELDFKFKALNAFMSLYLENEKDNTSIIITSVEKST